MGVKTVYIDDLTGEETAERLEPWTIDFDGDKYTVEVTEETKTLVKGIVQDLMREGSLVKGKRDKVKPPTRNSAVELDKHTETEVRKWAQENGIEVKPKGKLSNEVKIKFLASL